MAPLMYEGAFPAEEASLAAVAELTEFGEFLLFPIQLVRVRPRRSVATTVLLIFWRGRRSGAMDTWCGSLN